MVLRQSLPCIVFSCILICPPLAKAQDAPQATIWSFLGIPQGLAKAHGSLVNHKGKHPGLEAKPPVVGIANPANLEPKWKELGAAGDAVQVAAKVKQAEDAAPQKIKAVKYLAKIGCGCYDELGVTAALAKSLDDCTESVRLATIEAISDAAEGGRCASCNEQSCCKEEIVKKLAERAYKIDETGCFIEPSEKVRDAAREALCICCPGEGYPEIIDAGEMEREERNLETPEVPAPADATNLVPLPGRVSSRRRHQAQPNDSRETSSLAALVITPRAPQITPDSQLAPVVEKVQGVVRRVDTSTGLIHMEFERRGKVSTGTTVDVVHEFLLGPQQAGELTVVKSSPGFAVARVNSVTRIGHIARGDVVHALGEHEFRRTVNE
jgi:hypothetical protein